MFASGTASPPAVVVGCGVVGLSCARRLQEEGWRVRIVARDDPMRTTSATAGAIWFPYRAFPADKVAAWGAATAARLALLAGDSRAGVRMVDFLVLGSEDHGWRSALAPGATRDEAGGGVVAHVPLMETPRYLAWLLEGFERAGGTLDQRELASLDELDAPLVVNCAGAWAGQLVGDPSVVPVRGQVVHVRAPGATRFVVDESGPTYVLPRADVVVCGGSADAGDWDTAPREDLTRDILRRCAELEPAIAGAEVLGAAAGLRPGRPEVRVEAEPRPDGSLVVHDYGHGGAGFTLAWGCADEVAAIAARARAHP